MAVKQLPQPWLLAKLKKKKITLVVVHIISGQICTFSIFHTLSGLGVVSQTLSQTWDSVWSNHWWSHIINSPLLQSLITPIIVVVVVYFIIVSCIITYIKTTLKRVHKNCKMPNLERFIWHFVTFIQIKSSNMIFSSIKHFAYCST